MDTEVREVHPAEIKQSVTPPSASARSRLRSPVRVSVVVAVVGLAATLWQHHSAPQTIYQTQPIIIDSLTAIVTTSGTLEPRNQLEVSSELSGTVRAVYVQENDAVAQGQLLAALDTSRLKAQLIQAQAAVAFADAQVRQSSAALTEATTTLRRLWRLRELSEGKLPSRQDLDTAEAALARARGEHAAARAAVAQAQAHRDMITSDLAKTQIRSPVVGVVLSRRIEPGQTVVASLQAPMLFTLADDLKKMELHVTIDEADITAVKVGQEGTFTVDAFPDQVFTGTISLIHMASNGTGASALRGPTLGSGSQSSVSATGVVTYETVLEVDNAELLLRPGMTATAEIATTRIERTTLVPNAALRFTPERAEFPGIKDKTDRGTGMMALMAYIAERWKCPRENGQALGCVWVLEDGEPMLAIFKPGATDRTMTQVLTLDRLPNWGSLARLRNDPIMKQAFTRKLAAGDPVIVDATSSEH